MKFRYLVTFFVLVIGLFIAFCGNVNAQGGSSFLRNRCPSPNSNSYSKLILQSDGDINAIPCPGDSFLVNGAAIGTGNITGTLTNGLFPVATGVNTIANSPYGWDGTIYEWNNTALNSEFTMDLTPSTATGLWRVGDFTTTPTVYQALDLATDGFEISARNVFIGDSLGRVNGTLITLDDTAQAIDVNAASLFRAGDINGAGGQTHLRIDDNTQSFVFANANQAAILDYTSVNIFSYFRTITPPATTGNQTIHKPVGTVNFAAGATAITITNNDVDADSIIFAVAQTDDATCSVKNTIPALNSFVINMTAACTAETRVAFLVTN